MRVLSGFLLALVLVACGDAGRRYSVEVSLIGSDADSLSLYCYDADYGKLLLMDRGYAAPDHPAHFTGRYYDSRLAFVKLDADAVNYYFVLDDVPTRLAVGSRTISVADGSDANRDMISYIKLLSEQRHTIDEQRALYAKLVADSMLDASSERAILAKCSAASDSVATLLGSAALLDGPQAYIIWRRFGKYLNDSVTAACIEKNPFLKKFHLVDSL
ncbi:MAG: hypothetical protein ACI4A8_09970 [Muribaculaceae bacterium]